MKKNKIFKLTKTDKEIIWSFKWMAFLFLLALVTTFIAIWGGII